jgi:DHA1 family bicyclomycin/chloramphenicol resistance-like MFS transporter
VQLPARAFVYLLPVLVALQAISTDLYLPALPALVLAFETDVARVQLTLSSFLFAFAVAQLVYGPLSDRFGRRLPLLVGTALYALAGVGCALSTTIDELIAWRVIQAIGACAGPVLGRAVVRDLYEPAEAARVLALVASAMALAPALGPILGGWLAASWGWRATFVALAVFGGAAFLGVAALMPETNRHPDPTATRLGVLARNYAALVVDRSFMAHVGVVACGYSGIFTFISGSAYVLIDVVGLSPLAFGLSFAAAILGWVAGTFAGARLGRRVGLAALIVWGTRIAAVAGIAGLVAAVAAPPSLPGVIVPMAVYLLGVGLSQPTSMSLAIAPHPTRAGVASALLGFLQLSAAALVGLVLGLVYDGTALPMMAVLAAVSLVAVAARRAALAAG